MIRLLALLMFTMKKKRDRHLFGTDIAIIYAPILIASKEDYSHSKLSFDLSN